VVYIQGVYIGWYMQVVYTRVYAGWYKQGGVYPGIYASLPMVAILPLGIYPTLCTLGTPAVHTLVLARCPVLHATVR